MSRIIAGRAGGVRLATPNGDRTRPTTDRVREALFSSLATWNGSADAGSDQQLAGIAFCDLFAGSGAVGLEAASRGADPVVLVESDAPTARLIQANATKARLRARVETATVDAFLQRAASDFDVIWLDPPYPLTNEQLKGTLALAMRRLVPNGLLILERSARTGEPVFPDGTEHWSRSYGETSLHYCQFIDPASTTQPTPDHQEQS